MVDIDQPGGSVEVRGTRDGFVGAHEAFHDPVLESPITRAPEAKRDGDGAAARTDYAASPNGEELFPWLRQSAGASGVHAFLMAEACIRG